MNDKIDEFALQSQKEYGDFDGSITTLDYRKFAELIIQECIEQCAVDYNSEEDWDKGVRWAVKQIKEHFGVE